MSRRLVDLSHEIVDRMTTYPGLPGPVISAHLSYDASRANYAPGTEFQIGRIEMVANTGTYLDTPAHRYRGAADLAELGLEQVADLPGLLVQAASQAVDAASFHGRDPSGRAVLVHTGWSKHWGAAEYGATEHPFLTEAAARMLVDAGAALVGIDSVNIDDTSPSSAGRRPVHSLLLAAGIPVVEHLCGLEEIGDGGFRFFAVPVKVRGLGSFPVRAFAIVS